MKCPAAACIFMHSDVIQLVFQDEFEEIIQKQCVCMRYTTCRKKERRFNLSKADQRYRLGNDGNQHRHRLLCLRTIP